MYILTAATGCIVCVRLLVPYCGFPRCSDHLAWRHPATSGRIPTLPLYKLVDSIVLTGGGSSIYMSYVYILPFKILFQQVFISLSSLFRKHGSFFFCSFGFFSSLLVQFTSVCVPWETVSKWILNSSLIFILRN